MPDNNTAVAQPDPNTPLTPEQVQAIWEEEATTRNGDGALAAAVQPAAEPQPAAEAPPAEAPDTPEFPEELKAALAQVDSLKTLVDRLTHQVSSSEGRLGAIQRELQQAKQAAQSVQRSPNEQAVRAAAKTPEKWAALKNDFPEWAEAVESLVDSREQPQADLSVLRAELQGAVNDVTKKFYGALEEAKLFGAYRNYRVIVNGDDFKAWQAIQAPEVQALAQSSHASDAIDMIDRFMEHRQKEKDKTRDVEAERNRRLTAAAQPAVRRNAAPPKGDEELTAADIWNQEAGRRMDKRAQRT